MFDRHDDFGPTLFHEDWWLEAVSSGMIKQVEVRYSDALVAKFPYITSKIFGQLRVHMPPLTFTLGPTIVSRLPSRMRISKKMTIISDLMAEMPASPHMHFRTRGSATQALAFSKAGFRVGVDCTIEIPPSDQAELWSSMRDKNRNAIRRAADSLQTTIDTGTSLFVDFYEITNKESGRENFYDKKMLTGLIDEAKKRGRGCVFAAWDRVGEPVAMIFMAWDEKTSYYLLSARATNAPNGAMNLLLWEAIKRSHSKSLYFDCCGIHIAQGRLPNLTLLSGFGGEIVTRLSITRSSMLFRVLKAGLNR